VTLSNELGKFWNSHIENKKSPIKSKPFSGSCMFCARDLTEKDEDHSVCNGCWVSTVGIGCRRCDKDGPLDGDSGLCYDCNRGQI